MSSTPAIRVTTDEETFFAASFVSDERWNGFAMPYFSRDEAMKVMAWNNDGHGYPIAYDEDRDVFVTTVDGDAFDEPIAGTAGVRLHGVGAGAWMWDVRARAANASDVAAAVARTKTEILEDIADGRVPSTVATFSELHDYVDANSYAGMCDDDTDVDWLHDEDDATNTVQNEVDGWLRRGRLDWTIAPIDGGFRAQYAYGHGPVLATEDAARAWSANFDANAERPKTL